MVSSKVTNGNSLGSLISTAQKTDIDLLCLIIYLSPPTFVIHIECWNPHDFSKLILILTLSTVSQCIGSLQNDGLIFDGRYKKNIIL